MEYLVLIVACTVCIEGKQSTIYGIRYCYSERENTTFNGGVVYPKLTKYQDCKLECSTYRACVGIRYAHSTDTCSLGFDSNTFNSIQPSSGVSLYTRYRCNNTVTREYACDYKFTLTHNTEADKSIYMLSGITVNHCMHLCLLFTTPTKYATFCPGFDYNFNTNRCNLQEDYRNNITFYSKNNYYYRRYSCDSRGDTMILLFII